MGNLIWLWIGIGIIVISALLFWIYDEWKWSRKIDK